MPTYAYRCKSCGHVFERVQKITDAPRVRCPVCRTAAERVITGGGGFLLKGEGFYSTDYRSEAYKKAARAETDQSPKAAAGEAKGTKAAEAGGKKEKVKGKSAPGGSGGGSEAAGGGGTKGDAA